MRPYRRRPRRSLPPENYAGWRLKRYQIRDSAADAWPDAGDFAAGVSLARLALPRPALDDGRCGAGFVVEHAGHGVDYVVLAWWDRENELPLRVFVREHGGGDWRDARGGESVCVWDLEVIAFERDAYVDTLLAGGSADDYLARRAPEISA